MAVSIDNYLRNLSSQYYLKNNSEETYKINVSVNSLQKNLSSYFGDSIDRSFTFGSYERDTILPRKFDRKSDVDVMVIFNTSYTPETYRNQLQRFAHKYYYVRYRSTVVKSFPTITLSLNNISYDLVPAKEETSWFLGTKLQIPGRAGWRETNPHDVKENLREANIRYNGIVRPLIRLMKAWNCNNGYPYDSYLLELEITALNFYNDTIETGLFFIANSLIVSYNDSVTKRTKVAALKNCLANVKEALDRDSLIIAKIRLHKLFPYTV